jgi:hypothetical protein
MMFQRDMLRQEIENALAAPKSDDILLDAKREHGLRFLIVARQGQSMDDVTRAFHEINERFALEPLFPSPPFPAPNPDEPRWSDTVFVATVYNVAFDDVSTNPWDIAHAARADGDFVRVSPEIPVLMPDAPPEEESDINSEPGAGWETIAMKINEAWAEIRRTRQGDEALPGKDVLIGHPDTGWFDHEVWDKGALDKDKGWNFVENGHNGGQRDSQDPLTDFSAGHGTAAASVIVAPEKYSVVGVAPYARLAPIRAVRSVILNGGIVDVARAIEHARTVKCQVISLSLGWYNLDVLLRTVIQEAVSSRNNIIVIAAAGQYSPSLHTCSPANYPESIGVAGIQGINGIPNGCKPWWISHRDPAGTITISAPATPAWRAEAVRGRRNSYGNSHGTTFATAFVAGIAAMWLAYHFPKGYKGNVTAQECYREHLKRTASRHWSGKEEEHFVGIVNAEQLIKTNPKNLTDEIVTEEIPDLTNTGEVIRLLGSEHPDKVRDLLVAALAGSTATADTMDALEAWAGEVRSILNNNPTMCLDISSQVAASTMTAPTFCSLLTPFASEALRQQLVAAKSATA